MRPFYLNRLPRLALGWIGLVVLASCSSAPTASDKGLGASVPSWVLNTPSDEGDSYVFVGSGTSESGDAGVAEKGAAADLRDQIVSYLGVKITSTTNATAKGSLDSYRAEVEQTVVSQSKAEIAGLRIADRYPLRHGKALTLYIKALYNKTDLDREKNRLQALFAEVDDAVSIPEKKGDDLAAAGDIYGAVDQYTLAASAALNPDMDNGPIRLQRNLGKAESLLAKLTILPLMGSQSTLVGTPFAKPFGVKVVLGSSATDPPVPGVALRFNYKVKQSGRLVLAGFAAKTDEKGEAFFTYPTPDFAASDNIIVVFDVGPFLDRLSQVPRSMRDKVEVIEDTVGKNRLTMPFVVQSGARKYPLAWSVLEFDDAGTPTNRSETSSGATEILTKEGFQIHALPSGEASALKDASDDKVLAALGPAAAKTSKRLAFGTASIAEIAKDGTLFTARATGNIKVWDLSSGTLLYSQSKSRRAVGSDKASAEAAALHQLGADFGQSLVNELP